MECAEGPAAGGPAGGHAGGLTRKGWTRSPGSLAGVGGRFLGELHANDAME